MEFYHINQISGRNEYIDFLRGVAALGIIAIHTAFWSGQSYTPEWFQNITLYLDVPFFFYLSGWGSSYRKSDVIKTAKSVLKVWCKWIFFISFLAVFCLLSQYVPVHFEGVKDVRDLFSNYMFNVSIPGFRVVAGSIWFMPYYIIVVVINALILMFIEKSTRESELKKFYAYSLVVIFLWISYDKYVFGLDLVYFVFYSFFWMLGMLRFGKVEKFWKFLLVVVICLRVLPFSHIYKNCRFMIYNQLNFPLL